MTHAPPAKRKDTQNGSSTNNAEPETEQLMPTPPDGGWGWVVVFASFMIHIVTDGMTYSFGILHNEFLTYFGEGQGYTSLIVSLLVGVTLCSGPISSSFVNRYGCRAVTIAGSVLGAACILLSTFAQNILTLIITIGIGTGLGFGLIYLPAIVSVTTYFEKYRSLATGIAVCGSGLGTFIFAPLIEILIGHFGWRGAMLIISGVVLNCIFFGIMFRPLEAPKPTKRNRKHLTHSNNNELQPLKSTGGLNVNPGANENNDMLMSRSRSVDYNIITATAKRSNNVNAKLNGTSTLPKQTSSQDIIRATVSQPHINNIGGGRTFKDTKMISGSGTMYRPDILYQGSLLNIPEYKSRTDISMKSTNHYGSMKLDGVLDQNQDVGKLCGCVPCSKETRDTFSEMMNFSLFRDMIFLLFTFSNFCTSIGFYVPYVYIVSRAEELGIEKDQGSYLLSTIGIANTIGRIILGYIADKPWVNRLLIYNVSLTLCGVATALSIYCVDFISLVFYASVFGFTIGAYVGLTSVILVDLLGLDKLTNAFGLLLLFQGAASLAGPPFAGWLYDISLSYTPGFLMAGGTIAISGLVLFAIPPLQRYYARIESKNAYHTESAMSSL